MGIKRVDSKYWSITHDLRSRGFLTCGVGEDKSKEINIRFLKVKAHSGIDGNEEADKLAKNSVGL